MYVHTLCVYVCVLCVCTYSVYMYIQCANRDMCIIYNKLEGARFSILFGIPL